MTGFWAVLRRRLYGLLWPRGLGGRTILVLSAAVVIVHLGTVWLYHEGAVEQADKVLTDQVAAALAVAAQAMIETVPAERDARAHALSHLNLVLHWGEHATTEKSTSDLPVFRRRLRELSPGVRGVSAQFGLAGGSHTGAMLNGSVTLADGTFLNFTLVAAGGGLPEPVHSALLSTTLMALGVVAVASVLLRSLIRPLRHLAAAADAIGLGPKVAVAETGPEEVRHVAQAFNGMQARISRLIDDRTLALAAVSHDLRTPITRLRLRAGFLRDPEMQAAIDADLQEMDAMIEATLAYLRGDNETEPKRVVDLAALLSTLTDNLCDAGKQAIYAGPQHMPVCIHPSAIRRAFANLVGNAVTYGGSAHVTATPMATGIFVRIEDTGPGIAPDDLDRVFEPFQRLENSRNRGTGGVGLGLAIARQAIEKDGGSIRLTNRMQGGLCAEVFLPTDATCGRSLPVPANAATGPG